MNLLSSFCFCSCAVVVVETRHISSCLARSTKESFTFALFSLKNGELEDGMAARRLSIRGSTTRSALLVNEFVQML